MSKEWKCYVQSPRWDSSTVCGVPSGRIPEEVLKRQETSAEKQTPAEYLGSELRSGNENIMRVYICSTNLYAQTTRKTTL